MVRTVGNILLKQGSILRQAIRARKARKRGEPAPEWSGPGEGEIDVLKNWQTSLAGILGGIFGISTVGWTKPDGTVNWASVGFGVLIAILGVLAKDHNTTGGTVAATPEAAARITAAK